MIILDANILKSTSLRGPAADVLRAIRATKVERVAAPWIAVEEIAAQEALSYEAKHEVVREAVDTLRKATPWADVPHPRRYGAERVRRHWRDRYSEIVEVMETSASAYQQAMFREANLLAPCKTTDNGKKKIGARDAAIWLTAVEYAKEHPTETVYFVSGDKDFGIGEPLPPPMDKDLHGLEHRFSLFTSLDGVLTKFATEVKADPEEVRALLETQDSYKAVLEAAEVAAKRYRTISGSPIFTEDSRGHTNRYLWKPQAVALSEVVDVGAREIGGHKWFTASVRWLLAQRTRPFADDQRDRIGCAWDTRVLLSPTSSEKGLTILGHGRPGPVRNGEMQHVPRVHIPELDQLEDAARASSLVDFPMHFHQFLHAMRSSDVNRLELQVMADLLQQDRSGRAAYNRLLHATDDAQVEADE